MVLLYDIYGALLTPRQRRVFELRHHRDLSLAEIAAGERVSRQAVHDVLRRTERTLVDAERRLGVVARYRRQQKLLEECLRRARRLQDLATESGAEPLAGQARALVDTLEGLSRQL